MHQYEIAILRRQVEALAEQVEALQKSKRYKARFALRPTTLPIARMVERNNCAGVGMALYELLITHPCFHHDFTVCDNLHEYLHV